MDTLGELANMLGGSVKALLAGPSMLSLPTVAEGDSYSMTFPGAEIVSRVDASCSGEPVVVALLTRGSPRG
jgi:chemotaxis protein CheX